MVDRISLISYLDELLHPDDFHDYCPNGLQVEGCNEIKKIMIGVSASQELLDRAVEEKVDAVLVHHGYFWKAENPCILGIKQKRIATLLQNHINLIAYHLPLDAHQVYGNNVQLAHELNFEMDQTAIQNDLILKGNLSSPMSAEQLSQHIAQALNREPLCIAGNNREIKSVAWCSGAAQDFIEQAANMNVDAFLTGEISERTPDLARELGIHFFAIGHYASEQFGVQALGQHLAEKFNLEHQFVLLNNPI